MDQLQKEIRRKRLDQLYTAFQIVAEGAYVYLCDMKTNLSRWSSNAVTFFGLPDEYMYGADEIWEQHIHPDDRELYHRSIAAVFSGQDEGHDMQYRAMRPDGSYVICTCRGVVLRDDDGQPNYFGGTIVNHGILSNISELTGLRNQYGFFEDLEGILRRENPAAIALIGISRFSDINTLHGYKYGNRVLQRFARFLKTFVGNNGAVYRMDGSKFAVISSVLSQEEMEKGYLHLQRRVQESFTVDGTHQTLTLHAGLLPLKEFELNAKTAYSCLSFAYRESKLVRKGEMVVFSGVFNEDSGRSLERYNAIRDSIVSNCDGFYLCYQPVVDAFSEKVAGAEALIRWRNAEYGVVSPDNFISVLENDALFQTLGDWILRTALRDGLRILEKNPEFILNVNLSYSQLEHRGFAEEIDAILEETGYPPQNLCLEITERCRLMDLELLRSIIEALHGRGIRFAMDDFGTGFSSLGVLKALPIDVVKIDREFTKDIATDILDREAVNYSVSLGQLFGAQICAEGVETEEMRDYLRKMKVQKLQGYYYSRPIEFEEFYQKYVLTL